MKKFLFTLAFLCSINIFAQPHNWQQQEQPNQRLNYFVQYFDPMQNPIGGNIHVYLEVDSAMFAILTDSVYLKSLDGTTTNASPANIVYSENGVLRNVPVDSLHVAWDKITGKPVISTFSGSWNDLTDKPSVFTPALHTHPWSDIIGAPAFLTAEVDGSVTNEIQTISLVGSTISLSSGGGSISNNDADASVTNELQTLSKTGNQLTLSNSGGTYSVADSDSVTTNEGSLSVGAGTGTTSIINSNTSGSTGITISAGSNVTVTELGNTITIAASTPGTGTVTSVGLSSTDFSVSGSPVTTSGSITANLNTTGVSAGTYDWVTVDTKGRVTSAGNAPVPTIIASGARNFNQAYQISSTRPTTISVSVQISCNLSLTGGQAGNVQLQISPNGSTGWLTVAQFTASNTGTLTIGLNTTQISGGQLVFEDLPAGYYWQLVTTNTTGTPTYNFNGGYQKVF